MKKLYIVTGAKGHLGNTIIRMLRKQKQEVRGLILPNEIGVNNQNVTYYRGDIRNKDSIKPIFKNSEKYEIIVIHTAGIISIENKITSNMYDVNVKGTKNLLHLALEYHASKFIHVSSVHAIPEGDKLHVLKEIKKFSEKLVKGGYAKTKATATEMVLTYVKKGLSVIVVQPSGILGPYDNSRKSFSTVS